MPTPPEIPMERRLIRLNEIDSFSKNARWPKKVLDIEHPNENPDLFSDTLEEDFPNLITDEWISFNDLVQSIGEVGILQDPHVMEMAGPIPTGEKYKLLYGFRRTRGFWAASDKNMEAELWVMVHPPMSESTVRILQLTENYHRRNMDFVADLEAVRTLYEEDGLTERKIAEQLGISPGKSHSYVVLGRLINRYENLKTLVEGGALGYNHLAEIEKTLREIAGDGYKSLGASRHEFVDDRLRDVVDFFVENIEQTFQDSDGKPGRGAIRSRIFDIKKRLRTPEAGQHVKEAVTRRKTLMLQAKSLPETEFAEILDQGGRPEEHLKLSELPPPPKPTGGELRSRRVRAWAEMTGDLVAEDWKLFSEADLSWLRITMSDLDRKMRNFTDPSAILDELDEPDRDDWEPGAQR